MAEANFRAGFESTGYQQVIRDIRGLYHKASVAEQLERRRLLEKFNEGIVQKLVGLHLKMEELSCQDPAVAGFSQLNELLCSAIENAHILADEIAPHVLFKAGLRPALHGLFRKYAREYGVRYFIVIQNIDFTLLDETVSLVLFNVIKKLLYGAVNSCHADTVGINMQTADAFLQITVQDNGLYTGDLQEIVVTGFAEEKGFMLEAAAQVHSLGGGIWVDKAAGMRTVCLVIPLKRGKACC